MDDRPFNLQPPAAKPRGPQNIAEFWARARSQPGGIRAMVAARRSKAADQHDGQNDVEMADSNETDEPAETEAGESAEAQDINAVRAELLHQTQAALATSNWALDFLSLLISREAPTQAASTLSPETRAIVGLGTLGATMLAGPTTLARSRETEYRMTAIGQRYLSLENCINMAQPSQARLEKQIQAEEKYWSEVSAVKEAGFRVARMAQEPQTMCVSFGFLNAAPEFKESGIAPLRRADDGSVKLELGRRGGGSQRIRVSIIDDDKVVGQSSLSNPLPEDATLVDRVKDARNTIFAQELWHEINREARTLGGRNVRMSRSSVTYSVNPTRTISIELVSLESENADTSSPRPDDHFAESLSLALSLQLSHAHKLNERRRAERNVAQTSSPVYALLSPIVSWFEHEKNIGQCIQHFLAYTKVLRSAGLPASVLLREPAVRAPPGAGAAADADDIVSVLYSPPAVEFDVDITAQARLRVMLKPPQSDGPRIAIWCLPPPVPGGPNPLQITFPPNLDDYLDSNDAMWYLNGAVSRALTAYALSILEDLRSSPGANEQSFAKWSTRSDEKGLADEIGRFGLGFDFVVKKAGPELTLSGTFAEEGGRINKQWSWSLESQANADMALGEVLRHILSHCSGS
ncbi:putative mediator of RNA polymerase II transcription subunit 17 [Triangularia verruculosa]|uniref:Mediator of RNA polymerase II transcription subunit 17 n=1 Tax=Triangularia verruculosa TaxID=2587418 RepID=A0AAN6XHA5_9PEZI|nr:putative mediator of RNA polymerase II transcription subunit 17 [Triangularia verruculosa]